jgi:hypothetical protein
MKKSEISLEAPLLALASLETCVIAKKFATDARHLLNSLEKNLIDANQSE